MSRSILITFVVLLGFGLASAEAQKVYWSDVVTDSIQRANLDGTEVEQVVESPRERAFCLNPAVRSVMTAV